jgi:thiol-disulfide isomerase/thioredoxin
LELFRWTEHWQAQRVLVDFYEKTGAKDNALEVLSSMQQSVANLDPKDPMSQAAGWPMVADMAIAAGQLDKARAALARMDALRAANQPKPDAKPGEALNIAMREGPYWESAGKLAEAEGRKLDAVAFYLNAKSAGDEEKARALWASLGGTGSGWEASLKRTAATAPETNAAWQTRDLALPDFALEDITGKKIRLADLKGKTIFLNIWATWCGPCREELPQVEELYRTLKDRTDVAVVTIDADENPALVKPFLDRGGYSFPVVLGSEYVFKTLGVDSIPRNWMVDKAGVVRMELNSGNRAGMAKDVLPMIEKMKDR